MNASTDIADIIALLDSVSRAYRERDPDGAVAADAPDATIFDLAPPLQRARSRDDVAAWLENWKGPVEQEFRNLQVHAEGGIALVHGFVKVSATTLDGQPAKWWMRYTAGLRRENGNWKIVHEHSSVPFYMDGSFRAAIDLEP